MIIILRDPDVALADVVREYAMASESSVTVVPHGIDALFWLVHTRVAVVVVEATGNGDDAAAVARVVRSHPVNGAARVVTLVGPEGPEAHGHILAAGATDVIAAPPTAEAWRALLRRCAPAGARITSMVG